MIGARRLTEPVGGADGAFDDAVGLLALRCEMHGYGGSLTSKRHR